jgi:hypothetical protein
MRRTPRVCGAIPDSPTAYGEAGLRAGFSYDCLHVSTFTPFRLRGTIREETKELPYGDDHDKRYGSEGRENGNYP